MSLSIQEINRIYNGFEVKDMPRQQFVKEMQRLTNPAGVQTDFGRIMAKKQTAAIKKQEIDRTLENESSRRN